MRSLGTRRAPGSLYGGGNRGKKMMFQAPTDGQVIEQVRRQERWRPRIAGVFIVVGLAGLAFTIVMGHHIYNTMLGSLNWAYQHIPPGPHQSCQLFNEVGYKRGFLIGMTLLGGFTTFFSMAFNGFLMTIRDRKNQLLLRCWDVLTMEDANSVDEQGA